MEVVENRFIQGLKDSVPIGLGYLSVSFTFGMMCVSSGIPVEIAVVISLTNLTSAGQFNGLILILEAAPLNGTSYVTIYHQFKICFDVFIFIAKN